MSLTTFRKFLEVKDVLIVEANKDEIYQKYYKQAIDEESFNKIIAMFQNNSDVRWIVQAFKELKSDDEKRRFLDEDMPKLKDYFETLNMLKRKNNPEAKALNLFSIKSIGEPKYRKILRSYDKDSNEMKEQYVGKDCEKLMGVLKLRYPLKNGVFQNEQDILTLLNHI